MLFIPLAFTNLSFSQVTTSSMTGTVKDAQGEPLIGATVQAIHEPSGTTYGTATNLEGRYTLPGMRSGGPYSVKISYTGYQEELIKGIDLQLGSTASIDIELVEGVELQAVEVISIRNDAFSSQRKGTATNISESTINTLPTLDRDFTGFIRLAPQASTSSFGTSFGGQDNRLNNITIDGSILNSSFGLSGTPGGRTGTAAISLDAIEEVQINMAPYDVRQSGFVGAGVNAVTRSGTNEFQGSAFFNFRNQRLLGEDAGDNKVSSDNFQNIQTGFRLGGPLIKDKLFFFSNVEIEKFSEPALWTANEGGEPIEGTKTRVLRSDLESVSNALADAYGYNTGPFQGYNLDLNAIKFLVKLDYNVNDQHKLSLRYNRLDSEVDRYISNSRSLGFGNRRTRPDALSYQNSNYVQNERIHSIVGEWNALFGNNMSNQLIAGYTYQNEDRGQANPFPLIEMQQDGLTYISTGTDPFTPSNSLNYHTYQIQNNLSIYRGDHSITAGVSLEHFRFENLFFPGSFGVFVYNSVEDFLTDIQGDLADPNRETSDVELRRFQFRYSALPGGALPVAQTRVWYPGIYGQDEWRVSDKFDLTFGLRLDMPVFENTALENPVVSNQTYELEGDPIQINTSELPKTSVLFSPRFGFNYKPLQRVQFRGGTGLFTGRPAFVWISNQVSNNGVLTGFEEINNTNTRPFTTDPIRFIENPEGQIPSSFQIDISERNLRFPQTWRSNLAVDVGLFWGIVGTLEFIYNRDVNNLRLYNINQAQPSGGNLTNAGGDDRPLFAEEDLRINENTTSALYLSSNGEARAYNLTAQLEKPFDNGLFFRLAYNYGNSQNLLDLGSTTGSWFGVNSVRGNNDLALTFSQFDQRHRIIGAVTYRLEYGGFGASQIGLFLEAANQGRFDYVINGDINGDNINDNDLLFVPNNANDLQFQDITDRDGNVLFTAQEQANAFETYISQDEYLSERRGQYVERNGALLPWNTRLDLSFMQEFFVETKRSRNTIQLRLDIINFTNLLNKEWGVGDRVNQTRPLRFRGFENGSPVYQWATFGNDLLRETFSKTATLNDVWQMQVGVRYIFN